MADFLYLVSFNLSKNNNKGFLTIFIILLTFANISEYLFFKILSVACLWKKIEIIMPINVKEFIYFFFARCEGVIFKSVCFYAVGFNLNNKSTMSSWPTSPFKTGNCFSFLFSFTHLLNFVFIKSFWRSLCVWI